jgi:outer membrane receptor for ferrienterochelin and colicins
MLKRRWLLLVLFGVLLTSIVPTHQGFADGNADEAELQFQLGIESYQAAQYRDALEHFLASHRLVPNRNVVFNIADAFERLGKYAEAYRYYVDALDGEQRPARRALIDDALQRLGARVGVIDVQTDPPGATVYVNRKDLGSVGVSPRPLAMAPGQYQILVELDGYHPAQTTAMDLSIGQKISATLTLMPIVGTVKVSGEEGTQVRVDSDEGAPACTIPCALSLVPGSHTLFLRRDGRANRQRQVFVTADQETALSIQLDALTGSLLVRTEEREALVEVDGEPRGFTPAVITGVPIGARKVRVSLAGYRPVEVEVDIQHDEQALLDALRLVPLREVSAASRAIEAAEDAPASISIISSEELRAFQYPTLFEALRGVRGFALTFDSIYGNAAIRGLGQPNDYNNRMLLLSDGATLNDNILSQAFISYDGRASIEDVDRIEIIRGAGSVIYGTGAVSGVVNMVPRRKDDVSQVKFSIGTADQGVARLHAGLYQRLGERAGVEVNVAGARSDGWEGALRFDADGDGVADRNLAQGINSFDALMTTGRAWYGDVNVQWLYNRREIRIPTGSFGSTFNDPSNAYTDQRGMLEVRYEPKLSDSHSLMLRAHADMYVFDLAYRYATEVDDGAGNVQTIALPYSEDYLGVWGGAEARWTYQPSPALRFALGAEISLSPKTQLGAIQTEPDGRSTTLLDRDPNYQTYAGYTLLDWKFSPWAKLSVGTRLDAWDRAESDGEDFFSINPRLALILQPSGKHNVKIMAGRAFRAPSAYEFFYTDSGLSTLASDCCGSQLKPETFYQSEVEYTYQWTEDWSVLGSVHGLYAQDFISSLPVPGQPEGGALLFFGNNNEDQLIIGADVEVRRELRRGWMFSAYAGALWARFLSDTPQNDTGNKDVPNAPIAYGALKGIVPLIPERLKVATRFTLEAPRRIDQRGDATTQWAVVGDLVFSGQAAEYHFDYALGLYNMFDWQYDLPLSPFPSSTLVQQGRSVLAHIGFSL